MNELNLFIYDSNSMLKKKGKFEEMEELKKLVVEHNKQSPEDKWYLIMSASFPPVGLKWDNNLKEFVEKTLAEKIEDGDVSIPQGYKFDGADFIRKTLRELYDDNELNISPFEKISEDGTEIVNKSEKELIEEGIITIYSIAERKKADIQLKAGEIIGKFMKKYPPREGELFRFKRELANRWNALGDNEKLAALRDEAGKLRYKMFIVESGAELTELELAVEQITKLVNKILKKDEQFKGVLNACTRVKDQALLDINKVVKKNDYDALVKFIEEIEWPVQESL